MSGTPVTKENPVTRRRAPTAFLSDGASSEKYDGALVVAEKASRDGNSGSPENSTYPHRPFSFLSQHNVPLASSHNSTVSTQSSTAPSNAGSSKPLRASCATNDCTYSSNTSSCDA